MSRKLTIKKIIDNNNFPLKGTTWWLWSTKHESTLELIILILAWINLHSETINSISIADSTKNDYRKKLQ